MKLIFTFGLVLIGLIAFNLKMLSVAIAEIKDFDEKYEYIEDNEY